jgi:hypothetical protein
LGISASSNDATPTTSIEDIRATADAKVYEMLTQTQAAMPTSTETPVPPTETPLPSPTATFTPLPTQSTPLVSPTVTIAPTEASSSVSCTEQQLSGWTGDSARLAVTNNVKDTTANVFLCITTAAGEVGYISIPVVKSGSAMVPMGCYSATAWVSGKKNFNATTSFCIKSTANMQLVIDTNSLKLKAGCAPNC